MIEEWIINAFASSGVTPERLSPVRVSTILRRIQEQFVSPTSRSGFLWELFEPNIGRRRDDGWSLISDYETSELYFLIVESDTQFGYKFGSGYELKQMLQEAPYMEFYVTNEQVDHVLCYNHHGFIVGAGTCMAWLETLADEY